MSHGWFLGGFWPVQSFQTTSNLPSYAHNGLLPIETEPVLAQISGFAKFPEASRYSKLILHIASHGVAQEFVPSLTALACVVRFDLAC